MRNKLLNLPYIIKDGAVFVIGFILDKSQFKYLHFCLFKLANHIFHGGLSKIPVINVPAIPQCAIQKFQCSHEIIPCIP